MRVITNRYREKDGGDNAAENLIQWLRNPSESPFPKTLALMCALTSFVQVLILFARRYCSNTGPLQHLQTRSTFLSSLPNVTQKFALFESAPAVIPPP